MLEKEIEESFLKKYSELSGEEMMVLAFLHKRLKKMILKPLKAA